MCNVLFRFFYSVIVCYVLLSASCVCPRTKDYSYLDVGKAESIKFAQRSHASNKRWVHSQEAKELLRLASNGADLTQKYLLEIGVDPDGCREPPAAHAIWGNNEESLQRLLKAGANPNRTWRDIYGERHSLLTVAYRENARECVPALLAAGAVKTPAYNQPDKEAMRLWLEEWRRSIHDGKRLP